MKRAGWMDETLLGQLHGAIPVVIMHPSVFTYSLSGLM
jgi:hypothetical protein